MQKRREVEERILVSSNQSLGLLFESKRVGAATPEELNRQKEQPKRTEERFDDLNPTLKTSERHLQVQLNNWSNCYMKLIFAYKYIYTTIDS